MTNSRSASAHGGMPQLGSTPHPGNAAAFAGLAVAGGLVLVTCLAHAHVGTMGPVVLPFLPICATIWLVAELLTAFFLLSQFYVGGQVSLALVAATYGFSGLAAIPYLAWFPGLFSDHPATAADAQISAWLWIAWHLAFPIGIAAAHVLDGTLDARRVPRAAISRTLRFVSAGTLVAIASVAVGLVTERAALPHLVTAAGKFTDLYKHAAIPLVVCANAISLAIVLFRMRSKSRLQISIALALLAMTLDGIVNAWAPGRYSIVWYVGKFEAVGTSIAVLCVLLLEVATLYRRLYDVACVDSLTSLPNRRRFDDYFANVLNAPRSRSSGIALLVVDVDCFKSYNDRYGHAAGDDALQNVARAMERSLHRATDFVARVGGEEFAIVLRDVALEDVARIAERMRGCVQDVARPHAGSPSGVVTISVGGVHLDSAAAVSAGHLFERADRALYDAKANGRNSVCLARFDLAQFRVVPPAMPVELRST